MFLLAKYGVQTAFTFAMVKRGVVDLAVSADWTPATGDAKISKDGGNVANTTNNPAAVGGTGSALWALTLTATELQCAEAMVQLVDSATKAVEDNSLRVYTYGHASAKIPMDLSTIFPSNFSSLVIDANGNVKVQSNIKKNQALAKFSFYMTDSTNHNPATGKTPTVTRSIDGASASAGTLANVTEVGNGFYTVDFGASDLNGNVIAFRATATGCDDTALSIITEP